MMAREGLTLKTVIATLLVAAVILPLPPSLLARMPDAARDAYLAAVHTSRLVGYYCGPLLAPSLDAAVARELRRNGVVSCAAEGRSRDVPEVGT